MRHSNWAFGILATFFGTAGFLAVGSRLAIDCFARPAPLNAVAFAALASLGSGVFSFLGILSIVREVELAPKALLSSSRFTLPSEARQSILSEVSGVGRAVLVFDFRRRFGQIRKDDVSIGIVPSSGNAEVKMFSAIVKTRGHVRYEVLITAGERVTCAVQINGFRSESDVLGLVELWAAGLGRDWVIGQFKGNN